jgi:hypothetical protein
MNATVPFDPAIGPRRNLIEWVGEDDRLMMLVRHCDAAGIPMSFHPDEDYCYVDAVGPDGKVIARGDAVHTMEIDLDADRFTLLGSADILAGIDEIDRVYAAASRRKAGKELDRLTRL